MSASHHMLLVRSAVRSLASAGADRPAVDSVVQAEVKIDDQGELEEQNEQVVGQEPEVEVQVVVTAVAQGSVWRAIGGGATLDDALAFAIESHRRDARGGRSGWDDLYGD